MDLIAASNTLSQVSLLASLGSDGSATQTGGTESATSGAPSSELSLGQLVTAQVLDTGGPGTLVSVGQQAYVLNLPLPVSVGQTVDLQVLQTSPALQFRLVGNLEAPPAAAIEANLSPVGALSAFMEEGLPTAAASNSAVLVQSPGPAEAPGLGQEIATQIQGQFEAQFGPPFDVPSAMGSGTPFAAPAETLPSNTAQLALSESQSGSTAPATSPSGGNTSPPAIELAPLAGPSGAVAIQTSPAAHQLAGELASAPSTQVTAGPGVNAAATAAAALIASPRPNATASILAPAIWQGAVWPDQTVHIQIEPDRKHSAFDTPSLNAWRATLKLTLPNLGQINAQVAWSTAGLRIHVDADSSASAEQLRDSSSDLLETLRSLNLRIQSLGVRHV